MKKTGSQSTGLGKTPVPIDAVTAEAAPTTEDTLPDTARYVDLGAAMHAETAIPNYVAGPSATMATPPPCPFPGYTAQGGPLGQARHGDSDDVTLPFELLPSE